MDRGAGGHQRRQDPGSPLADIGGKGLFVKEIEERCSMGRALRGALHQRRPGTMPRPRHRVRPRREDPPMCCVATSRVAGRLAGGGHGGHQQPAPPGLHPRGAPICKCAMRETSTPAFARSMRARSTPSCWPRRPFAPWPRGAGHAILDPAISFPRWGRARWASRRAPTTPRCARSCTDSHPETALCVAAERGVMIAVEGDCRTPSAPLRNARPRACTCARSSPSPMDPRTARLNGRFPARARGGRGLPGKDIGRHLLAQLRSRLFSGP